MTAARILWLLAGAVLVLPFLDLFWRMGRATWVERAWSARMILLLVEASAVAGWVLVRGRFRLAAELGEGVVLAGALLALAGAALSAWSKLTLGQLFSVHLGVQRDHQLITHGPYALVRHPMYLGIVLYILGSSPVWNDAGLIVLAAVILLCFAFQLRSEEIIFARHFGAAYDVYRARVPALLPLPRPRDR